MKKVLTLFLVLGLSLSFSSCGSGSKTKIATLAEYLRNVSKDLEFNLEENSSGYAFEYQDNSSISSIEYVGTADKKQNVLQVDIIHGCMDVSTMKNQSRLMESISKDGKDMTMSDFRMADCVLSLSYLCQALGGSVEGSVDDFLSVFSREGSMTISAWEISVTMDAAAETVTISARQAS